MTKLDDLINPDEWSPGLAFGLKTLSAKSVRRAKHADRVVLVALQHNLRRGNEAHRHRSPIDAERSSMNAVVIGPDCPDAGADLAASILEGLDIRPERWDALMAIELVMQPPGGADQPAFWSECLAWAEARYEHVISAVVHRDQKRPHMHLLALAVADGRLQGSAMTTDDNQPKGQRIDFCRHMFERFGIRPNRQAERKTAPKPKRPKTLEQLAVSTGKGAKTRAEAARRDADLVRSAGDDWKHGGECMGFDVHGVCLPNADRTPCTAETPNPILRSLPPSEVDRFSRPEIAEKRPSESASIAPPTPSPQGLASPPHKPAFERPRAPAPAARAAAIDSSEFSLERDADPLERVRRLWARCSPTAGHPIQPMAPCPKPATTSTWAPPPASATAAAAPAHPAASSDDTRIRRERESDHSVRRWCEEVGEFIAAPATPSREARLVAADWVAAGLARVGRRGVHGR